LNLKRYCTAHRIYISATYLVSTVRCIRFKHGTDLNIIFCSSLSVRANMVCLDVCNILQAHTPSRFLIILIMPSLKTLRVLDPR
jgi:hypothetical protein